MTNSQFRGLLAVILAGLYLHASWITGSSSAQWWMLGVAVLCALGSLIPNRPSREDVRR